MIYAGYAGVPVAASAHAGELCDNVRSHFFEQPFCSTSCCCSLRRFLLITPKVQTGCLQGAAVTGGVSCRCLLLF